MTTFDDREQAFEKKFAHDAEMQFKASARRNKKLGHWVGERMGLTGAELDEYAQAVIVADLEEAGDDDVFRKVFADIQAKGVQIDEATLRAKMTELMAEAKADLLKE